MSLNTFTHTNNDYFTTQVDTISVFLVVVIYFCQAANKIALCSNKFQ